MGILYVTRRDPLYAMRESGIYYLFIFFLFQSQIHAVALIGITFEIGVLDFFVLQQFKLVVSSLHIT